MKYIVFDTETNGLPRKVDGQTVFPMAIQLAWAIIEIPGPGPSRPDYRLHTTKDRILNHPIPRDLFDESAASVHGITYDRMREAGMEPESAYREFITDFYRADVSVCHNHRFDFNVIIQDMRRYGLEARLPKSRKYFCTCQDRRVVDLVKLPHSWRNQYKWPKLEELHGYLFPKEPTPDGMHNAMNDVMATVKCFVELQRRGVFSVNSRTGRRETLFELPAY